MRGWLVNMLAAGVLAGISLPGWAQGIYTCVDAKGRRITSDRAIIDCIDREQTEIAPSGKIVRRIGPSLTVDEQHAEDEKQRRAIEERNRQIEERRRDRALLSRYPDRATHDSERVKAIAAVDEVIHTAARRIDELLHERRKLDSDLEFFGNDIKKASPQLKRRFDENEQQLAAQKRFIANQEEEKKRINVRYDQELARLNALWAQRAVPAKPAASAASQARK